MKPLGPQDPQSIGEYRLVGRLGEGGMGQVYIARSARGRTVALKLVLPELARQPEFRQRFRNEVEAARRIGGAWTAPVLDADLNAETPWVATGYVAGPSLHEVVAGSHGPLPERSALALANGLGRALRDIHAAGLIHRDLKPSNVLVTIDGPRVIDFGIARAAGAAGAASNALTRTGAVVGSPGFMSPEQCRGEPLTAASDIFCLGSVLAFAATARSPFGNPDSAMHVLMLRIIQDEKDLTGIPDRLRDLIAACLAPAPTARPTLDQLLAYTAEGDFWHTGQNAAFRKQEPEPWLPSTLIAGLGRQAVDLLDSEEPAAAPPGWTPTTVAPATPATGGFGPPTTAATGASPHYAPTAFAGPPQPPPPPGAPGGYAPTPATPYPAATARRSSQPWLIGGGAAALILILILIVSTSGGGSDDEEGTSTAGAQGAVEGSDGGSQDTGEGQPVNDEDYIEDGDQKFFEFRAGDTVAYTSGLVITVSPAEVLPSGEELNGLDPGEEAYKFTVVIENAGEKKAAVNFDPYLNYGENSDDEIGGNEESADELWGGNYLTEIYRDLEPGGNLTGEFAFAVPAGTGSLVVEHIPVDTVTRWTLELP